jgi:hypothetical protein
MTPCFLTLIALDYLVESAPHESRAEAESVLASFPATPPARVVRRFRAGAGWEFFVRVEGFASEAELARYAAPEGAEKLVRDGTETRRLAGAPVVAAPVHAEDPESLRTPALLRSAIKAHGGKDGGRAVIEAAPSIAFEYTRTIARTGGHTIARHTFLREGPAIRLEVDVTDGPGVDSVTVLTATGQGWAASGGDEMARDGERTAEVLARFSPEALLAVPLGIPDDMETAGPWKDLEATARVDGDRIVAEAREGAPAVGIVAARFGREDRLLHELDWALESGRVSYVFDDYRAVADGLVVPFSFEMRRDGAVVETMRVARLEVGADLPDELFRAR